MHTEECFSTFFNPTQWIENGGISFTALLLYVILWHGLFHQLQVYKQEGQQEQFCDKPEKNNIDYIHIF